MNNYHILYNAKTKRFYANNMAYYGSSKEYAQSAVDYIEKLQREHAQMREQLKLVKVTDMNSDQMTEFARISNA